MGRSPCCDDDRLKKGPWMLEEDKKLVDYIKEHGHGNWSALPKLAGLNRCGKSCRLRWTNYLRPDIKRGKFSEEEEQLIIYLHSRLGNKWSAIAARLPQRTDNEIKNYWNTHLKKKLLRNGIDPVTHRRRADLSLLANLPNLLAAANLGNLTNTWDDALRMQEDAAQLARIQLLQSIIQAITSNSLPNMDVISNNLMGSAFLKNYQASDLQSNCQFQGLLNDYSLGLIHGLAPTTTTTTTTNLSNYLSIPQIPNDFQHPAESCLPLGGNGIVSQMDGSSANAFAVDVDNTDNQISNSYSNPTANSTPSLASASPENHTMNQIQDLINPNDMSANSSTSAVFDAWEGLNLDEPDNDFFWRDILDQTSLPTWSITS